MYIIKRNISGLTYFWNDTHERWEGLEDNASVLDYGRMSVLMNDFRRSSHPMDYTFKGLSEIVWQA